MDISSILGLVVGFGMLIAGFVLEKGNVGSLFLTSPALIVFGGTLGAVMVSFSLKEVMSIPKLIVSICTSSKFKPSETIDLMVSYSEIARKEGLLSLEKFLHEDEGGKGKKMDPFLQRGLAMVVDGSEVHKLRDMLETDISVTDNKMKIDASIFEAAGGYSPTMGIVGTVMGLIQVLSNMGTPEELARSIAVAFIATLYGVCFANLVYLPIAGKLKLKAKYEKIRKELIIESLASILNGETPRLLKDRLAAFLQFQSGKASSKKTAEKA